MPPEGADEHGGRVAGARRADKARHVDAQLLLDTELVRVISAIVRLSAPLRSRFVRD
jgi:hypothetical protein